MTPRRLGATLVALLIGAAGCDLGDPGRYDALATAVGEQRAEWRA